MSAVNHLKARVGALSRSRASDDPDLAEARRDLKAATLQEHVAKVVASWPPLTPEQLDRVAGLLAPAKAGAHE